MGLDMYAYSLNAGVLADDVLVDFELCEDVERGKLAYWRKHSALHGWMEALYYEKGGSNDMFNCVPVRLDAEDLDELERAINDCSLPAKKGFFFGTPSTDPADIAYEINEDLEFIEKARDALASGRIVYYSSWW